MKKTKYYVGFNKETKLYKNGFMIIDAQSVNQARHMLKKIFADCKDLPPITTEAQLKNMEIEDFCDEPRTCRGEFSVYKETEEQVFCNVRMNLVFHPEDGIFTATRVEMERNNEEVQNR